jgi:MFS family permease
MGSEPASRQPAPLRRNRDFQLLWGGQAVSLLGSQTSKIAYPLLVLAMTGSPAKAGIAGFAAILGYLVFPLPAGGLADRHDRKRIMIACDAIRLAAVGSVAVAGWAAHITYVQVLVAGFAEGTASVFFGVAQRAALPILVHPSQRSMAVYRMQITPNELLGRTSSVALQVAWGVIPLGSLLAGFLLQALSPAATMTAVAAGMAVTAAAATVLAPVRDAGRRNPGASGPAASAADAAPAAG